MNVELYKHTTNLCVCGKSGGDAIHFCCIPSISWDDDIYFTPLFVVVFLYNA